MTTTPIRAAWANIRRDNERGINQRYTLRQRLAVYLDMAHQDARNRAENAQIAAELAAMRAAPSAPMTRKEQIDAELLAMELSNFIDWPAYKALKAERERLA